jgi:hypothetical protein
VSSSSRRDVIYAGLSVAFGLGTGWPGLHIALVIVTIVALFIAGKLLGLLAPRAAWRGALLLALGLPAVAEIGRRLDVSTTEPICFDPFVALAALGFVLVGWYGGVLVRRAAGRSWRRAKSSIASPLPDTELIWNLASVQG